MQFKKNKIISMSDLERRFSFDPSDKRNLISNGGLWSQVWKVRDKNGKIYAGKFPPKMYYGFEFSSNKPEFLDIVATSRNHENWIAQKIFEINVEYTPKPEGVFAIECGKTDFYFPAFVNEYDESFEPNTLRKFSDIPFLEQLIKEGFFFRGDLIVRPNVLISKEDQKKLIDFGWWGYKNTINPYPRLKKEKYEKLEYYNFIHNAYTERVLELIKE